VVELLIPENTTPTDTAPAAAPTMAVPVDTVPEKPIEEEFPPEEPMDMSTADVSAFLGDEPTVPDVVPFEKEPTSEIILSKAAEVKDFDEAKFKASAEEVSRRDKALSAALFATTLPPSQIANNIKTIANAPMPKFSTGDAVANLIAPYATKGVKNQLGSDITVADARQINQDGAAANLGFKGGYAEGMSEDSELAKTLVEQFDYDYEASWVSSMDDALEYMNPGGSKGEAAGMDLELWQSVKDIASLDFDADAFGSRMESNYGKEWGKRWGSFLLKEAAVDVGILVLAFSFPPLAAILKLSQTALRAKVIAGVSRTAIVAGGGTFVQVKMNERLGRDSNVGGELLGRTLGVGAGEILGAGARIGINAIKTNSLKKSAKATADALGTKPMNDAQLKSAITKQSKNVSAHSAMARAILFDDVKKYGEITNNVADSIMDKKLDDATRVGLSNYLGVNPKSFSDIQTDVILPLLIKNEDRVLSQGAKGLASINQDLLGQSLLYPLMARAQGDLLRMNGIRQLYFSNKTIALRETGDNINNSTIPILNKTFKRLGIAEPVKDAYQSAANWLSAKMFTSKQTQGFAQLQNDIYKGLSSKDSSLLHRIIRKGDGDERVYDFTSSSPADVGKVPINVQQAYAKFRFTQDLAYEIADAGKVESLKGTVFKLKNGEHIQKVSNYKGTPKAGHIWVRTFDVDTLRGTDKIQQILASAVKGAEIDTIIPYRNGHVPRIYRDQRHAIVIVDIKTGTVSREATFDSGEEARKYLAEWNSKPQKNKAAMKMTQNTATGSGDVSMGKGSMNLLSAMDEETSAIIRSELAKQKIDEKSINVAFDKMFIPNPAKAFAAKRTRLGVADNPRSRELRLKHSLAPTEANANAVVKDLQDNMPISRSAMMDYYSSVAHGAGHDNWRTLAFKDWEKRFGQYTSVKDAMLFKNKSQYDKAGDLQNLPKEIDDILNDGIAYAKWLQRAVKDRSRAENFYDEALSNVADNIAKKASQGSKPHSVLSKIMDSVPMAKELQAELRFVAAFPKLLTLNFAQTIVQGTQSVFTVGAAVLYNPLLVPRSLLKVAQLGGLEASRRLGVYAPRSQGLQSARTVHKELIEGGYAADLASTDVKFALSSNADPSSGRKMWENTKDALALPFKFGEAFNRVTAYVTVRDQFAHALIKGKKEILGFDGIPMTKDDIGTPAFIEAVIDKASVMALSMGKAGELRRTSGFGSVILQFKQVLAKEVSIMDSSKLSGREKLGGAAAMIGTFGLGVIPLSTDLLNSTDWVLSLYNPTDDPTRRFLASEAMEAASKEIAGFGNKLTNGWLDQEDIQRVFKSGGIAAATDNEWNFANRVALGNFITDMVEVQGVEDLVVSLAVLTDMNAATEAMAGVDIIDIAEVKVASKFGVAGLGSLAAAKAAMNVFSYIEVYNKVNQGMDFKRAFALQFAPESSVSKYLAGDISLGAATLEATRLSGKVFSQIGSVSRVLDAANRDIVSPLADQNNPLAPVLYNTSGNRTLPVEVTRMRNLQLLLGIQPGKIIEMYSKREKEIHYADALKKYTKTLKKRLIDAKSTELGPFNSLKERIRKEGIETYIQFKDHVKKYGLDVKVTNDAATTLMRMIITQTLQDTTGKRQ
tara:strand:+ start:2107 stop:6957 length:4851 start_codon:yes stop_codon:yes gene_type:complete